MNIIDIQNVTKKFSNHIALNDFSLSIPQGCIFGLLGPNGAGKTTLIRILNQITAPDSGVVLYDGKPLCRDFIEKIGYLPEERGLYKKMKISEQTIYLAQLKGLTKEEAKKRLLYWFKKFEIESWWNRKVEELSKGMQQKIQFIVTIIHHPDFLIFDEPFSGFDPINTDLLKNEILQLKKNGNTIILSTHNMASVEEICDEIVLINKGEKVLSGKLGEVKHAFKSNLFQIEVARLPLDFLTEMPASFQITETVTTDLSHVLNVQISSDSNANQLLDFFIHRVPILSFHEILPSMNEIFIRTITSQNNNS